MLPTFFLSVFDHFTRLALKVSVRSSGSVSSVKANRKIFLDKEKQDADTKYGRFIEISGITAMMVFSLRKAEGLVYLTLLEKSLVFMGTMWHFREQLFFRTHWHLSAFVAEWVFSCACFLCLCHLVFLEPVKP